MLTPQNQAKKVVSVIPFPWCKSFGMVNFFVHGFGSETEHRVVFFMGAVKLHCLSSQKNLPQYLWYNSRVFWNARLNYISNIGFVMVILIQCGKSPKQKWLKFSQNAYLANTKGFSKNGVGLVSGPNIFLRGRGMGAWFT